MKNVVDFYLIKDTAPQAHWRVACRLLQKIYAKNHRVHVQVNDPQEMKLLDDLLWTFHDISFIPHRCLGDNFDAPIQLSYDTATAEGTDILMNTSHATLEFYPQFSRILEIVSAAPDARKHARERFRHYREQNYSLNTHEI